MSSENPFRPLWRINISHEVGSMILLVAIIAFSIISIIVFAYHIFARFALCGRRSAFQDLSAVSQPPKRGLDTQIIASLPTFVVRVNGDVAARECVVCLSLFDEKDTVRMLPNCKHVFHVTCVDTWLITRSTCPICRSEVEPSAKLEPEPREGLVGDGASVLRLDSVRRILSRERSSNRIDHYPVDQDRVLDLERQ